MGCRGGAPHPAGCHPLVRRQRRGERGADRQDAGRRHPAPAERGHPSRQLPAPFASGRRRPRRAPDLRVHDPPRGRRPEQPLDGPRRSACGDRCPVRRLHAGPHDVRHPVLHGADRFAALALRRGNHRLALRGCQHADHDPHGRCGAGPHRARRQLREGAAFGRRTRPQPPLHHAFPRGAHDQVVRLRLRWQRPAGQEVPRAAHRKPPGPQRRLAGRAHADPRHREPAGARPITSPRRSRPPAARPTSPC